MHTYDVVMWKRSDYCDLQGWDVAQCAIRVTVRADNKYQAAMKALEPHIEAPLDWRPIIYEIIEL